MADAGGFSTLYSFGKIPYDSEQPTAPLLAVNGTLYGTAHEGGDYGAGTVFSITTGGSEKKLHDFTVTGGSVPYAGLVDLNGTFYGTTYSGGANAAGTVFSVTRTGKYHVLHSFNGGKRDGQGPQAGLVALKGTLYGTTSAGGASNDGTVFSITPGGAERVLHSFSGSDGADPYATLIVVNGDLYGTTLRGGNHNGGTAFRISPSGSEKVLYKFCGPYDGCGPSGNLVEVNGVLYGTTTLGTVDGFGAIFKLKLTGNEQLAYNFTGRTDGCHPYGGLVNVNGKLYGTTFGTFSKSTCNNSLGTVFKFTPSSGGLTTLHAFGGSDGANPFAGLVSTGGELYGTTQYGGVHKLGVVYSVSP